MSGEQGGECSVMLKKLLRLPCFLPEEFAFLTTRGPARDYLWVGGLRGLGWEHSDWGGRRERRALRFSCCCRFPSLHYGTYQHF